MLRLMSTMAILGLLVAGCGTSKTDRGISGAGIGAAAGAGAAAVTGGSPVTGALLGGAAGGAAGVLTDEDDVNLGDPVWNRDKDKDNDDDNDDDGNLF